MDFASNFKCDSKDVVENLDNKNNQKYHIFEPSSLVKEIQLQAYILEH